MNNPYYKVTATEISEYNEQEISNRVEDLNNFFKYADFESFDYKVEKLSDEEFLETEK